MESTNLPWQRSFSVSSTVPHENQPEPPGPQLEPAAPPPSSSRPSKLLSGVILVVLGAIGLGVWSQREQIFSAGSGAEVLTIPTAKAEVKSFRQSLRTSGTIAAKRFAAIRAPRMRGGSEGRRQQTLMKLAPAGETIQAGTVVAEFENRWLEDHIDDVRSTLAQSKSTVEKRRAEIMIATETEQQSVRVAQADLDKAKLDLRTAEVRSEIEAEKLKLAVEEAEATLAQITQEVKLQQEVHAADIRSLELEVEKHRLHVERHMRDLERLKMPSPVDGLVVMESLYRGGGQTEQVQVGDQVNPGTFFMRVVDLSAMVVSGVVNQVDSQLVRMGQKAEVRLDAYPELVLPGKVTSISAMASSSSTGFRWRSGRDNYVKMVSVEVSIDAEDERVIPDLSGSADILLAQHEDALVIPRAAIQEQQDRSIVMVRQGEGFITREIEIGQTSPTEAVILAGLNPGDEVALASVPQA